MTDVYDRATEREEQMREAAIEEQQRRAHLGDPAQWETLSAKWCEADACGARIPDARRRALPGVRLCVDCAARLERGR